MVSQGIPEETGYIIFLFAATLALIATGPGRTRFIIQYYPYILMFVVYDVIAMFLFAWALDLRALGAAGTIPILTFMVVALVPLAYALHLAGQRENW